ncbi:MAG: polyphosphate kinase 2 family protein [Deltaproteobacteria bacterium]|nr:polyphosphate kinase 2 family protein [Deltaproteobacteria bacterium]
MRRHRVRPGTKVDLGDIDPAETGRYEDEDAAREHLGRDVERLAALQEVLYAEHRHAVLIVLQGMDTAGKDGTIKHVFSAVNPSGCEVAPFKVPTEEEADHDFLWRAHRFAPRRGHMTIFNRSHYEDVLVPFVHRLQPRDVIRRRYDQINAFERILIENGTVVLKFFLHVSKDEQCARLQARLDDPTKQWKFSLKDVEERKLWPRYQKAYECLLGHCSTRRAPWHVIPANHKWYRNLAVADILVETIRALDCKYPRPELSAAERKRIRL